MRVFCKKAILFLGLTMLISVPCNAQSVIDTSSINQTENAETRAQFWVSISTTSGNVIVPIGTYIPGASSYYVRLLQCCLNTLGVNCGTADGIYGTNTRNAVIRFQNKVGAVADGIVGESTWNYIHMYLGSTKVSF